MKLSLNKLKHSGFLLAHGIVGIAVLIFVITVPKLEGQFWINQFHGTWGDYAFPRITKLGEWIPVILVALFCAVLSTRKALTFACGYLSAGVLTMLGKLVLFPGIMRPKNMMQIYEHYHWVEGVVLRGHHSFPSGHTQSAFSVFFMLAILVKPQWAKFLCFCMAAITGFSRVYISQHFMVDILVGSVIAVVCLLFFERYWLKKDGNWLDRPLIPFSRG
ncbi:phosphatase PAP2 family protein [Luteibaculum oceani]|uniref:Phosphatase PAP2 family protein n=1 Tax=Luteibaculum oceani TaxID=1294296 RepID=A0A5C6UZM3_9FLAO|nr:phosphatase PAP2 family protein [Luteibaculum oceani]TXC78842.1 phosphatase PAP2 family protein [Luteibaculum oceani]